METAFILVVVALTSALALAMARRQPHRRLAAAAGRALEAVGFIALFLLSNVAVGFALALALRATTGSFVSLYVNDDVSLLVLSVLQALVWQSWREPEDPAQPRG